MAIELYKLIPDAFTILSEASQKIGQLGVAVVDQENSPRQQQTINSLIAATRIYRTIMRHVVLNDSGTAIAGIQHIEVEIINDLLENLKKTVDVLPIPVYPLPLTTVQFNFGTPGGGLNLGPGQAGDLIVHNGTTWVRLSKGPTGYSLTSTPGGVQWQNLVGNGIPSGGSTNQYLRKASNTDYDAVWGSIALAHVTDVTASAVEVNVLDGVDTGSIGASQINQLAGISTSQTIQQQLNAKMSNALASGQFWVGNSSNIAEARTPSGDVTFNNEGVFSYTPLSIEDADINTTAAIQRNKLAIGSSWRLVINNDSGVMDEAAAITANRALVSNANGIPVASAVTATELGFSTGLSGNIQQQLNSKLTVSLADIAAGDVLTFNGTSWVNLGIGASGTVLTSNGTSISWGNPAANGLPAGGSTHQVLRKADATDYNTEWHTLEVADLSDLSVTADELNVLSGVDVNLTATEINHLVGVSNPIQGQLDNKLTKALAFNNIWVGNAGNEAIQFPPGNEGEVLTITNGAPQWQPFPIIGDGVVGPGFSTDNAIARWNGTQGISIQNSGVIIDDSDNITGINSLTLKGGAPIRTGTTNGDTVTLQAYDVDGTAYVTFATLTAANVPTFDLHANTTIDMSYIYRQGGDDVALEDGGTGASLSDPGEYMLMFWNQSIGQVDWLAIGTNLSLSGSSPVFALNASGGGGGSGHVIENSGTPLDTRDNLNFTGGLTAFDSSPDTVVRLGGTFVANVTLDGASTYNFSVTAAPTITLTASTSLQVGLSTNNIAIDSTGVKLAFGSGSEGDLFYEDSSGYLSRVAIGTEGQILTVDAAGVPVWDDAPAGDTYTDSDAQNAVGNIFTDSTTIDFTYNSGTPSISAIVINNSIDNMKIRQSAGVSVVGRSANSTGNVADITASANGQVLMRSSNALSFGLITGSNFANVSANTFFGGPASGADSTAAFRALVPIDLPFPTRPEDATSYTIDADDHGYTIYFTSATGCTVTLPTGLPANFWFTAVRAEGAGTITFVASGSSDINTINNEVTIDFANGAVSWEYLGDSSFDWYGFGALGTVSGGGGGSGTVTSVNNSNITGLATATGGPITGSGTLGYTLNTQAVNTVFAGPVSGGSSTPSFRLLDMLDIPRPAKEIPTPSYTVENGDLGHNLYFTNSTGCVVTLNDEITVSNFWFLAIKDKAMTAGTVQFTNGGSSAILNTVNGETDIIADNGAASWEYKGSGDWYGWGTLGGGSSGGGGGHTIKNSGVTLADRPNINFRNGITAVDLNPDIAVGLGGSLVADTTINADSHDFKITAIDEFLIQRSDNNRIEMDASGAIYLHTGGGTASSIILHPTNGITVSAKGSGFGTGSMVVVDSTGSLINFGPSTSSLISKNAAGSFASVIVSNGITHDATVNTLKLGGALTANTTISGAFSLTFSNSSWTFGSRSAGTVGESSFSTGATNVVSGSNAFASGWGNTVSNGSAHALGNQLTVSGQYAIAAGFVNVASGKASQSFGNANTSSGDYSISFGNSTQATAQASFAGGQGTSSRRVIASGLAAFNFSTSSLSQGLGHGALADRSAILGGIDHNIESGNTGAAIIGGSGIKLTGTTYIDTVAVPHLAIFSTPGDGGNDDVLTWNSTTKKIGKVSQASLGGGGGSGTVTSVAATAPPAGFTISGSPITTSGTLTFALANDLAGLENLSGTGLAVRTGTSTWTNRTIVGGTGISVTNGNGVSANPTISLSHLGIQNLSNPGADRLMFWDQSGSKAEWLQVGTGLAISGTTLSVTQILDSGTYTPTFISGSSENVDSVTFHQAQYLRVGNVVTMSGQVTIDATAAGPVLVHFSPPVASESTFNTASGVVSKWVGGIVGSVAGVPDPPVHALAIQFDSPDGTSQFYMYTCTYEVI